MPDNFKVASGLQTNNYYTAELNDIERLRADKIHIAASGILEVHALARSKGVTAEAEATEINDTVDRSAAQLKNRTLSEFQSVDNLYKSTPQLLINTAIKAYEAAIKQGGDTKSLQDISNRIYSIPTASLTKPNQFAISNDTLIQINDGKDAKDIFRVITLDTTNQQQYSSYEVSYNAKAEAQSLRTNFRDGQAGNAAYTISYFTPQDNITFFDSTTNAITTKKQDASIRQVDKTFDKNNTVTLETLSLADGSFQQHSINDAYWQYYGVKEAFSNYTLDSKTHTSVYSADLLNLVDGGSETVKHYVATNAIRSVATTFSGINATGKKEGKTTVYLAGNYDVEHYYDGPGVKQVDHFAKPAQGKSTGNLLASESYYNNIMQERKKYFYDSSGKYAGYERTIRNTPGEGGQPWYYKYDANNKLIASYQLTAFA